MRSVVRPRTVFRAAQGGQTRSDPATPSSAGASFAPDGSGNLSTVGVPSWISLTSPVAGGGLLAGDANSQWYITADNVTVTGLAFPAPTAPFPEDDNGVQQPLLKKVITVLGNNATIKNCSFRGDAMRAVDTMNAGTGTLVQDCSFGVRGNATISNFDDAAVSGHRFTVNRCDFVACGNDAIKMGDDTVTKNSYIHHFATVTGGHGDGIQGIDTPHRIVIYNNYIDLGINADGPTGYQALPNSAVIITPWTIVESGPANNSVATMLIDHNVFGGGHLTFHVDTGFQFGIWVTSNRFLGTHDAEGAPIQNTDQGSPIPAPATFTGNVKSNGTTPMAWTDTSA